MAEDRELSVRNVTLVGMILNIFLAALKFAVGLLGHSQAVLADAFHSLSDLITDLAVLVGVKFWEPPADADHPYGHKKIESIVTFFIGILLVYVGFELLLNAISSIPNSSVSQGKGGTFYIALIGPMLSILGKEAVFRYTIRVGKRVKSSAVIANAWHHRSDAISSIPVLVAVLVAALFPEWYFVDAVGAIIVSGFIFKVAFDIIKPAFHELTDRMVSRELLHVINETALSIEGVRSIHKTRTRRSGKAVLVDMHVQVDGNMTVRKGHKICETVKKTIICQCDEVVEVLIHLEPAHEGSSPGR
jgi:cation diffusion facilitator family transporter